MSQPHDDPAYIQRSFGATASAFSRFLDGLPAGPDKEAAIACHEVAIARARAAVARQTGDLGPLREAANAQIDALVKAGQRVEAVTVYLAALEGDNASKPDDPHAITVIVNGRPYAWPKATPIGRDDLIDLDADEDRPLPCPRERFRVMVDREGDPPQYLHPGERVLPADGMVFHVTASTPGIPFPEAAK